MRISELKSPYKELAKLRMAKRETDELILFFRWRDTPEGSDFWCDVSLGKYPPIPAESLKELGEWVIGGEYEFSDGDGNWEIGKLLGIVDHEHPYIVLLDARLYPYSRLLIRHIEPQVKEVTI
jgi:hypothetical protein